MGVGGAEGSSGPERVARPRERWQPRRGAAQGCVHVFQNLFIPRSAGLGSEGRPVTSIAGTFLLAATPPPCPETLPRALGARL